MSKLLSYLSFSVCMSDYLAVVYPAADGSYLLSHTPCYVHANSVIRAPSDAVLVYEVPV